MSEAWRKAEKDRGLLSLRQDQKWLHKLLTFALEILLVRQCVSIIVKKAMCSYPDLSSAKHVYNQAAVAAATIDYSSDQGKSKARGGRVAISEQEK